MSAHIDYQPAKPRRYRPRWWLVVATVAMIVPVVVSFVRILDVQVGTAKGYAYYVFLHRGCVYVGYEEGDAAWWYVLPSSPQANPGYGFDLRPSHGDGYAHVGMPLLPIILASLAWMGWGMIRNRRK